MMKFQHPSNDYSETASYCGLWCLLFGSLYFAVKGMWGHFVISAILAMCTFGVSWLIYPFCAGGLVRKHYLQRGWKEINPTG
jgi:hypothetical protein